MWRQTIRTLPFLAAALLLGAAPAYAQPASPAQSAPPPAAVAPTPGSEAPPAVAVDANFKLGLADSVSVSLVGSKDFDTRTAVSSEGTVVLPLVGKVNALGLTTAQLEKAIEDALKKGGYITNPVVRVDVIGVASSYATILGDVTGGGLMPLDRTYHLSDIAARVGVRAGEGIGTIIVTHTNGESKTYTIEELATGSGAGDPLVQAGDKIYIPPAQTISVNGEVKGGGRVPFTKGMTIRDAIAFSGGLTDRGSYKKLKLFRKKEQLKDVNLDTPLQPGDILQVGESFF